MQSYSEMLDNELVDLYKEEGDDEAFTVLFRRYEKALAYHSRLATKRFPCFYEDEFLGYFQDRFITIVRQFDTSKGVYFAYYCKLKFPKLAHDYVRRKLFPRDGEGRLYTGTMDKHKVMPSDFSMTSLPDERYSHAYLQDVSETELFVYLTRDSDLNAKVITLIAEGYGHSEIATMLGRTGTDAALRNWTARIVKKIKEDTVKFYSKCDCADEVSSYADSFGPTSIAK
jgi:hypothetical protein